MKRFTSPSHQTLIVMALAASALVGAASGAVSASFVAGAAHSSRVLAPVVGPATLDQATLELAIGALKQEEAATIAVVHRVTPAVVSVVIRIADDETGELYEIGGGTGFFVSSDGYIVTNRHVVSDVGAVFSVVTNDGVELPAKVVAIDPFLDLALLDVEGDSYPAVTLGDSKLIQIGQSVIAIGNTLSEFRNTVTKGVISGINRRVIAGDDTSEELLEGVIQTDAAINPGNSGGPLIDLQGAVIGVNTAVSFEGQSLGFAIPINDIKKAVRDVEQFGRIVRPWLGVRYQMLDVLLAGERELPVTEGALLIAGDTEFDQAVVPGSPAEKAGLKEGDVIVSVNGDPLTLDHPLGALVSEYYPGDTVTLTIVRGEEQFNLSVTFEEYKL